jgi:4-hydroxy-tetrahydrodipicolinate synthase
MHTTLQSNLAERDPSDARVKPKLFATPLKGIVPPMVTPLRGRDELDVAGLERLIEHILAGGVHGLFILGTSGEAPNLSYRLRRELIDRTLRQVRGRVPVLVGITDTSFVEAVQLARYAADAGAQAVVTAGPYYFPSGQPELVEFVERLVPELPLPVFLYNMPQMTKVPFEPDTLRRVLHLERIVGVKDSSGDLAYFESLVALAKARPDWTLLVGPERLLVDTLRRGGHGGVNGGANIWPQLFVQLHRAASDGDEATVARLLPQLRQFGAIYSVGPHASTVVKGMKCALALLGICDDLMTDPFRRYDEPEREKIRAVLREVGLLRA